MENGELMLTNIKQDVSDEVISRIYDFKASLKMCKDISGFTDQQVAGELGIDTAQWSRIWTGGAHFPPEKIPQLMDICGNIVPLRWLSWKYGQELRPMKSTLERENESLRAEIDQKNREMEVIKNFLKDVKAAV